MLDAPYKEQGWQSQPCWFALRVKPNCEFKALASLEARGFKSFLPVRMNTPGRLRRTPVERPLFPGYVFSHFEPRARTPVLGATGVMQILAVDGRPHPVDLQEIQALQRLMANNCALIPWPDFAAGQRVQIVDGPLAGIEGIVLRGVSKTRLIVSVTLLQRSVMTEVEHQSVRAVSDEQRPLGPGRSGLAGEKERKIA